MGGGVLLVRVYFNTYTLFTGLSLLSREGVRLCFMRAFGLRSGVCDS